MLPCQSEGKTEGKLNFSENLQNWVEDKSILSISFSYIVCIFSSFHLGSQLPFFVLSMLVIEWKNVGWKQDTRNGVKKTLWWCGLKKVREVLWRKVERNSICEKEKKDEGNLRLRGKLREKWSKERVVVSRQQKRKLTKRKFFLPALFGLSFAAASRQNQTLSGTETMSTTHSEKRKNKKDKTFLLASMEIFHSNRCRKRSNLSNFMEFNVECQLIVCSGKFREIYFWNSQSFSGKLNNDKKVTLEGPKEVNSALNFLANFCVRFDFNVDSMPFNKYQFIPCDVSPLVDYEITRVAGVKVKAKCSIKA